MKNKALLIVWLLLISQLSPGQSLNIGDKAPNISMVLVTSEKANISTDQLKGKVILLDFWATWCGSCIVNMPHLDSLQTEFADQLQVIAISSEEQERLERFSKNKPFSFLYGRDGDDELQEIFPHRMIPHSVLINAQGEVVAITAPSNITHEIIQKVINGEAIELPRKRDNLGFDYRVDYFNKDSTTIESFDIQPYNPSIPGFTKFHMNGRRITMHNTTITSMYREAYEMSSDRLTLEIAAEKVDWENTKNRFNLDIIVAPEDKTMIREILREKLDDALDIKARVEIKELEVAVLFKNDSIPFALTPKSADEKISASSRGDHFSSNQATLNEFRSYLERFGIVGLPVVNETGILGEYKFDFTFDPENPKSFFPALENLGLKIKRATRKIEVLVIYEQ
jgi:uncharacterized protein (TIGR03435 family)